MFFFKILSLSQRPSAVSQSLNWITRGSGYSSHPYMNLITYFIPATFLTI